MEQNDRIRERAYQIWETEGCPADRAVEHWLLAEQELRDGGAQGDPFAEADIVQPQFAADQPGEAAMRTRSVAAQTPRARSAKGARPGRNDVAGMGSSRKPAR